MNMQDQIYPQQQIQKSDSPLVIPLNAVDASQIELVGGKGANLGELIRAGLPVPDGFCVTTEAYELASRQAEVTDSIDKLATTCTGDSNHLEQYAAMLRDRLRAVTMPPSLVEAL